MSEEIWRPIKDFPTYQISNFGRIFNTRLCQIMRTSKTTFGHVKITLKSENSQERFTRSVAVMVAEAFVESPHWLCDQVIILDGNLNNLCFNNLAWRPRWFAWKYTRQLRVKQPNHYCNLVVYNISTNYYYNNIIEAGMMEGLLFDDIWRSTYTAAPLFPYGYIFEIKERV